MLSYFSKTCDLILRVEDNFVDFQREITIYFLFVDLPEKQNKPSYASKSSPKNNERPRGIYQNIKLLIESNIDYYENQRIHKKQFVFQKKHLCDSISSWEHKTMLMSTTKRQREARTAMHDFLSHVSRKKY